MRVNIKVSKDKVVVFRLRRFDNLFMSINLFCEFNKIDKKLIQPIISKILSSLNIVYKVMNSNVSKENILTLNEVKKIAEK